MYVNQIFKFSFSISVELSDIDGTEYNSAISHKSLKPDARFTN